METSLSNGESMRRDGDGGKWVVQPTFLRRDTRPVMDLGIRYSYSHFRIHGSPVRA